MGKPYGSFPYFSKETYLGDTIRTIFFYYSCRVSFFVSNVSSKLFKSCLFRLRSASQSP